MTSTVMVRDGLFSPEGVLLGSRCTKAERGSGEDRKENGTPDHLPATRLPAGGAIWRAATLPSSPDR